MEIFSHLLNIRPFETNSIRDMFVRLIASADRNMDILS